MILCDREVELAMDQGRILILPRPPQNFMDSTTVDLRLDGTLDRWEFPPPDPAAGQEPLCFRPGLPNFNFSELEKQYTRRVDISAEGFTLPPCRPEQLHSWMDPGEDLPAPHLPPVCAGRGQE